jgi:hypothetical protein
LQFYRKAQSFLAAANCRDNVYIPPTQQAFQSLTEQGVVIN